MRDITPILQSLGFLESETKTYLASLQHGPATVLELTRMTKLSRQATYVVIESLTKRGIMTSVMRGKKKYFVAEDPEKLLSYAQRRELELQERIGDLSRTLPELKLKVGGESPTVRLYEGVEGTRTVVGDIAKDNPDVLYEFSDIEAFFTILGDENFAILKKDLKKMKTHVKGVYAGTPRGKTLDSERYFLPQEEGNFKASLSLHDNKVSIWTYEGKIYTIVIENKTVAKLFKLFFEYALKGAKGELRSY